MKLADYGDLVVTCRGDQVVIDQADQAIGVAVELLGQADLRYVHTDNRGYLVFAGAVTYRPVRFDMDGRVVVCERVMGDPALEWPEVGK